MSEKHTMARKARWAKVPAEERKRIMVGLAKLKSAKMTKEERSNHGKMMSKERWKRKKR